MRKKLVIILAVIMLLGTCVATVNAAKYISCSETKLSYKTFRGKHHYKYRINGSEAFCLERQIVTKPGRKIYKKASYRSVGLSKSRWETLKYIANVGYNTKRSSNAWYCATQQVMWEKLKSWKIKNNKTLGGNHQTVPGYSSKKKTILAEVKKMQAVKAKKVKFSKTKLTKKVGKSMTATIKDKNGVLSKGYKVSSTTSGVTAKISGNSLTVKAGTKVNKGTVTLKWSPNTPKIKNSTFFVAGGSQNLAPLGGDITPVTTKIYINSNTVPDTPKGQIEIEKEILFADSIGEESKVNLIGENPDWSQMQFTFYADDTIKDGATVKYQKDDAIANYKPNGGTIKINNILPGKYYLKETKTLGGLATDGNTKYPIVATKNSDGDVDVGITVPTNAEMQVTKSTDNEEIIKYKNFITAKVTDELTKEKVLELANASANKATFDGDNYTEGDSVSLDIKDFDSFLQSYKETDTLGIFPLTLKTEAGTTASFDVYIENPLADKAEYEATIYNHTIPVAISKQDITGEQEIEGAHLVLTDKSGKTVTEWDSTAEPYLIEGLNRGEEYTLKETIAPDNYVLSESEVKFTVQDDWSVQKQTMKDITVAFKKVDENGVLVNGAEIEIVDKETGEVVEKFTTDFGSLEDREGANDKIHYLTGLKEGRTYIAREAKAPVGYQVAKEIEFTVNKENAEKQLEITADGEKEQENKTIDVKPADSEAYDDSTDDVPMDDDIVIEEGDEEDFFDEDIPDDTNDNNTENGDTTDGALDEDATVEIDEEDNTGLTNGSDILITMTDKKIKIGTKALDSDTKDHISNADNEITINDTVKYENLTIGKEYYIDGVLMDKKTKKPLKDDKGNVIKSKSKKFVADKENGSAIIPFTFSGVNLKGKTTVVFETLYEDGIEVAVHKDIKDKGQTVYIPKIGTKANLGSGNTVKDVVSYKNLIPGKTYTMEGWLVNKKGHKISGTETTQKFTPKKANGKVTMTLNAKNAKGTVVVYEECKLKGKLVAYHKDINDKHQTVTITPPQTGDNTPWWIFGVIGAFMATGGFAVYRKRKLN